ncbi:MAG: XRE family transcriptional regulator [Pseudonocardiaceae bacterium]
MERDDQGLGELLSTAPARRALARHDVGNVYRLLTEGGVTQARIAELTGQCPSEVSEILAGRQIVEDYDVLVAIATGLGVPRAAMGLAFGDGSASEPASSVIDDDLPPIPLPERVGDTHVEGLEGVTAIHRDVDRRHGSTEFGLSMMFDHAWYCEQLAPHACSDDVHRRIALAASDAYVSAGWMAVDLGKKRMAWSYFDRARWFGQLAEDEIAVMGAVQSFGRTELSDDPSYALTMFQLALLIGSSTITQAFLEADEGWAHAMLGDVEAATRAIGTAKAMFEAADPDSARPSWMDPAQALPDLLSVTGAAQLQLGHLSGAVADLSHALAARPPDAAPARAIDAATLATAHLRAGEVEPALSVGHRAVDAARGVQSVRVRDRLERLHQELQRRSDEPSRELAERVVGLPTTEMARRLGISSSSLRRYVNRGLVEPHQVTPAGHYRFDPTYVRQQLQQLRDGRH